ncbi:Fic family protein [Rhodococcus qingshengii]|uniref:Fic/DOC family protein n=1 Tax=Rhodococcus qingshengii TaxID=334542 RepID=UPI001E2FC44B|nr:Fic family protein [Rhodococcus qingshengii]MCD2135886.1 Fic family protein [Rhodococcus qingshengii]
MPAKTSQFRSWDDYYIPGTTVLRNKLVSAAEPYGTTDAEKLRRFEERAAHIRMGELHQRPLVGKFDYDHLKAIHKALFADVYEWAGQERTGPLSQMSKSGPDVVNFAPGDPQAPMVNYGYYPAPAIDDAANLQFRRLAKQDLLRGRERGEFVAGLAEHWGEINTIHSFREGNTRTQFVFFSELSRQAGYELDISQFAENAPLRTEFVQARFYNQSTTRTDRLEAVLDKALTESEPPARSLSTPKLTAIQRLAQRHARQCTDTELER